jgi:transcriptional regulator with XRE-family HTH domain
MKYLQDKNFILALGKRVRCIRKLKGMSMETLAYSSGIEYSQLSRIEKGQVNTSVSHIAILAKTLQIPIKELFDFDY